MERKDIRSDLAQVEVEWVGTGIHGKDMHCCFLEKIMIQGYSNTYAGETVQSEDK